MIKFNKPITSNLQLKQKRYKIKNMMGTIFSNNSQL